MEITDEDRWKFLDSFHGKVDVFTYKDGTVVFFPFDSQLLSIGGKSWKEAIDNGIRLYRRKGLM